MLFFFRGYHVIFLKGLFLQACDFVGYYVIHVNLSKMEVIYVIFFRGYYAIFLKRWG